MSTESTIPCISVYGSVSLIELRNFKEFIKNRKLGTRKSMEAEFEENGILLDSVTVSINGESETLSPATVHFYPGMGFQIWNSAGVQEHVANTNRRAEVDCDEEARRLTVTDRWGIIFDMYFTGNTRGMRFLERNINTLRNGDREDVTPPSSAASPQHSDHDLDNPMNPNMSDGKLSSPEKDASPSSSKEKPKRLMVKLEDIIPWSKMDASDAAATAAPEGVDSHDPTVEPQLQPYSYIPELNDKVSIYKGDITKLQIEAIVNAAHESLLGGGGVDGAIHSAGGDELTDECETLNGCDPGDAKITGGYRLPAKHVIHTVGPRKETEEVLLSCYERCFQIFLENELKSIAFPCISTGIFGYPNVKAAHVALKQARTFLEQHHDKVDRVIFCVFLKKDLDIYKELMELYFPLK